MKGLLLLWDSELLRFSSGLVRALIWKAITVNAERLQVMVDTASSLIRKESNLPLPLFLFVELRHSELGKTECAFFLIRATAYRLI